MQLDLDDEETRALLNVLVEAIEPDHYPLSPRVELLRRILAKFGEIAGLAPDLVQKAAALRTASAGQVADSGGARPAPQAVTYQFFGRNYQDRGRLRVHLKSIAEGNPALPEKRTRCSRP
jgi:hypothetical protein